MHDEPESIAPDQCRQAREILGWSQARLADRAGLIVAAVGGFERGRRPRSPDVPALIRRMFEGAGVEFPAGDGGLPSRRRPDEEAARDVPPTPEQCREARRLLGWSQPRLAGEAGIDLDTVCLFERGTRRTSPGTLATLVRVLTNAGVEFTPGDARLREEPSPEEAILPGPAREAP